MRYAVLVVDDERLIAGNIAKSIEKVNPSFKAVAVCTNGAEAIEYLKQYDINVIFTDIRMPEMDGLELAKYLSEYYPYIECIIVSGYDDFKYAQTAIAYNVKNYLLKPVNKDELKKCLSDTERRLNAKISQLEGVYPADDQAKKPEEIVSLVKEYIHQNYQNIIDLSVISDNFGFSASYLTKIFTKYEGTTPSKYIKQYRISIAKQMLKNTDLPISVISSYTGFGDQFHFSKTFKNAVGVNPSQYRQGI